MSRKTPTRSRNFFGKLMVNGVSNSKTMIQNDCLMRLFDADSELKAISSELDSFDGKKDPIRCNLLVNRLRTSQDKVISLLFQLMDECNCERASRDYRMKFPDEILLSEGSESLNGQIWFGAECLSAGSNILNHTKESAMLRPKAKNLTAHLDSLRNDLRDLVIDGDGASRINQYLIDKMSAFDCIFAEFEYEYVRIMLPIRTTTEIEKLQEVAVLFSETLIDCLQRGLIKQQDIDEFQPIVMIAIPRLAIVRGLSYKNDNAIYTRRKSHMCSLFQPFHGPLHSIRKLLRKLKQHELYALEKMLCDDQTGIESPTIALEINGKSKTNGDNNGCSIIQDNKSINHDVTNSIHEQIDHQSNDVEAGTSNDDYTNVFINRLTYPVGQKRNSDTERLASSPSKFCDNETVDKPCSSSKLSTSSTRDDVDNDHHLYVQQTKDVSPTTSSSLIRYNGSETSDILNEDRPSSSRRTEDVAINNPGHDCQDESDYQLARLIQEFGPAITNQDYIASTVGPVDGGDDHEHNREHSNLGTEVNKSEDEVIHEFQKQQNSENNQHNSGSNESTQQEITATTISFNNISNIKNPVHEEQAALEEYFMKQTHQLLHKLFVAISGVADQLQSNFASDLRFILRHIFISEIENSTEDCDHDDEDQQGESSDTYESDEHSDGSLPIEPAIEAHEATNLRDLTTSYGLGNVVESIEDSTINHSPQQITTTISQPQLASNQQQLTNFHEHQPSNNEQTNLSQMIRRTSSLIQQTPDVIEEIYDNNNVSVINPDVILGNESNSQQRNAMNFNHLTHNTSPNDSSPLEDQQHLQQIIHQQQQQIRHLSRATRSIGEHQTLNASAASQQQQAVISERRSRNHNHHHHHHHGPSSRSWLSRGPPTWVPDHLVVACSSCNVTFTWIRRKHHCRVCGHIFCADCSKFTKHLHCWNYNGPVRVCEPCFNLDLP